VLKRKKMYEAQRDQLAAQSFNVDQASGRLLMNVWGLGLVCVCVCVCVSIWWRVKCGGLEEGGGCSRTGSVE
jgi:hypothetical protein